MTPPVVRAAEDVPRRALGTRIRRVKGDFVLGAGDEALLLTGSANLIFSSLDGRCLGDVARLVADEYGIDYDDALADVRDFLGDLTDKGIVEW